MSDQYLTPEMAQKLADIGYAPQEQAALQQQLDQAIALRGQQQVQRLTPEAQRYEGIGDMARLIGSFAHENNLRGQQGEILGKQKQGLGDWMTHAERMRQEAQAQALRSGQQPQQAAPPQPFTGMDYSQT